MSSFPPGIGLPQTAFSIERGISRTLGGQYVLVSINVSIIGFAVMS